jgi:hypothetical protein
MRRKHASFEFRFKHVTFEFRTMVPIPGFSDPHLFYADPDSPIEEKIVVRKLDQDPQA